MTVKILIMDGNFFPGEQKDTLADADIVNKPIEGMEIIDYAFYYCKYKSKSLSFKGYLPNPWVAYLI